LLFFEEMLVRVFQGVEKGVWGVGEDVEADVCSLDEIVPTFSVLAGFYFNKKIRVHRNFQNKGVG
jgi:hypothetical protein